VFRHLDWGYEAVAAPWDINDEAITVAPIAQRATQRGHVDRKVGRLDKYVGPNPSHQILLPDQLTGPFKQEDEDFHCATSKAHWLVALEQKESRREQAKWPEQKFRWRSTSRLGWFCED
jgi:hypothetical protein